MSADAVGPLSVFDMLKVGIGPSSSHTLGPWRAVQRWLADEAPPSVEIRAVAVHLFGSLALTGIGHATDQAIMLALLGHDPESIDVDRIPGFIERLRAERTISIDGVTISFDPATSIVFHPDERLPGHPNGMRIEASTAEGPASAEYYSVGGGFVVGPGDAEQATASNGRLVDLPYPSATPAEFRAHCVAAGGSVAQTVWENERVWRTDDEIRRDALALWRVMAASIHRGCHTDGELPGGLGVRRRARQLVCGLTGQDVEAERTSPAEWLGAIRSRTNSFTDVLTWVSAFALAVNEENAALGRVVTAPTNGAAGVVPAVLAYHLCFADDTVSDDDIVDFLLVAGEIATQFKKGATISAAMGGCQAEIGVSSAMAAGALAAVRGASVDQVFMAAEIATEHHLGLTCDPVGGLVQVPCIERNTMGAVKAINAAELALAGDPDDARVTLTDAIATLHATALDMADSYKETSRGGLAVNVSVRVPEC